MKYFRIVDPKGHHGMIYKEGYNEDILPFNPSGSCKPGGLYFSREDIFAFCYCGEDVYEVEPIGEIYEEEGSPKKFKAHALNLKYFGKINDMKVVKYLVENGADIHADEDYALRWSALNGHLEVVKYLVEIGADIYARDNYALKYSAINGHLDIVKYLVENGADIHVDNCPLRLSAENYHYKVMKYLKEQINKIS